VSSPIEDPPGEGSAPAILRTAAERATAMGLPYAGAVTPAEAWALHTAGAAALVDIRTEPEWRFVGHVPGVALVVWPRGGDAAQMQEFLEAIARRFPSPAPLLFLCRSGVRSHSAAELAARAGHPAAYNVLEGFEGDAPGRGWRAADLPWERS